MYYVLLHYANGKNKLEEMRCGKGDHGGMGFTSQSFNIFEKFGFGLYHGVVSGRHALEV